MNYDWKNFTFRPKWTEGPFRFGALKLTGHHHICAMITTSQSFTRETYLNRLGARGVPRFDHYGAKLEALPVVSKEELMALDMDHIMSAIHCPNGPKHGWYVEMYTNDNEDQDWIKFVKSCPYAKLTVEMKSRMGPYNIQSWLFGREFANG